MNFQELCRILAIGELSNLSLANVTEGTIVEAKQPQIVLHANTALNTIYSRFNLKEDRLFVRMLVHRDLYPLRTEHSQSGAAAGSTEEVFILDALKPFKGNVLKILQVADQRGTIYHLNMLNSVWSMHTPEHDVLQVPYPVHGEALAITYQTAPNLLSGTGDTTEIVVPDVLLSAFTSYIGGLVYSGMNTQEAIATSQRHFRRYEEICADIEFRDTLSTNTTEESQRFHSNGWT